MSLDGIVTRALVHELQSCVGARIAKIYQPTDNEIVLHIRGQGAGGRLLLSAHPSMARLQWTQSSWENPSEPPMFCMLLRKYCEGGVIDSIRQDGLERVVWLDVRHRDELGDYSLKRLTLEIMGRHSNLILMDPATGQIHDGIRHVTPAISSYRVVLPGTKYVTPPSQDKRDPLAESEGEFRTAMSDAAPEMLPLDPKAAAQALVNVYTGLSPLSAKEIVHRADGRPERLWQSFRQAMTDISFHRYCPNVAETPEGKTIFSALALTHAADGTVREFPSMHECLDVYYRDKADRDLVRQRTSDLTRFLLNETAKNEKKLLKLEETLQESQEADKLRRIGELLTAQLHVLKRGDETAHITDYYEEDQPTIAVALDPQLTPTENAQRYFRKYNKLKNSKAVVQEQMAATSAEIGYLASVLQGLETAGPADIEEIREELTEQGYIRQRGTKKGAKKKKNSPSVLCYTSSEGISIYVGKNNTQNDYVTNRLGQPSDTWLHTKDIPGSHVLIRSADFGETTLLEAAALAAYYSKARASSNVPVDYTLIRNVRKPNGAKPGFVTYEGQKTLFVTPDESVIQALPCILK